MKPPAQDRRARPAARLSDLLKPYWRSIAGLVVLTLLGNGLNLVIPQLIARAIDTYTAGSFDPGGLVLGFGAATVGIFVFIYGQAIVQTYASERVARDLRTRLTDKISSQDNAYIQKVTAAKLLTNLTSDIDSIKAFVAQAIVSLVSSAFLIVGASALMLAIDWRLGLAVLIVVPMIGGAFFFVLTRVRKLFRRSREAIDWLNKVITESIIGSSLIRLLNAQQPETEKFLAANTESRDIGLAIIRLFASLVPLVTFATNLATLVILTVGGHFVIAGQMTLGDFTAFNSYLAMLIFPIIVIGFMSNVMAQASASYARVAEVLGAPAPVRSGTITARLRGEVKVSDLTVRFGGRKALDGVSFSVPARSRTAIIGPTAAGKTQLLYALTGLIEPESGQVLFDGTPLAAYDPEALHSQVGFVFQDSIVFNLSVRENIAFSERVEQTQLGRAIETAELGEFIAGLPDGLDTIVSERGTSLSGGQKQRIMLARALALEPKILLLDDFTARVDTRTERRILANVRRNYPGITLISVTQKIAPVEDYDQIVLLMEGQVLARGRHAELMHNSAEYVQIYNSQQSTEDYELRA
jgi:ATP-binding cassette subfamily B protein